MERNDTFYKSFPFTLIVTVIVAGALWFFLDQVYGISFALGSFTTMFMMSRLHKSSFKVIEQDKAQAQRIATRNYLFRFLFYAIILLAAAMLDGLDLLTTGIGLFTFKIVFYVIEFIDKRGAKKDV